MRIVGRQRIEPATDESVALAGRGFKTLSAKDSHASVLVADEPGILEGTCDDRHRLASHA
jgi:hypothetical protein